VAAVRKPGRPDEPLVIPAGMQLASVASAGVPSQTFEVGAAASLTGPSTLPATLPPDTTLTLNADGTLPVLLAGRVGGVKPGDELLLVAKDFTGTADSWAAVRVEAIAAVSDPGSPEVNTLVTLSSSSATGWQSGWWLPWLIASRSDCRSYRLVRAGGSAALWHPPNPVDPTLAVNSAQSTTPGALAVTANLSAVVRAVSAGEIVLFQTPIGAAVGLVSAATDMVGMVGNPNNPTPPGAPTQPNIVIPFTQLALSLWYFSAWLLWVWADFERPGAVVVRYGFKDVGTIIGSPPATLSSLPAAVVVPASGAPTVGATALLQDAVGAGLPVTVTGTDAGPVPGTAALTLTGAGAPPATVGAPLAMPLTLLLDVIEVSRGKTVSGEVLGSGNAALANQSFALSKGPLTYLSAPDGPASTLAVYVEGVRWREVASFYDQPADARVFVVTRSADQTIASVTFGDGVNGARLPSGGGNVTATYRYGSGAASPPAGRLTTIVKPQPNLASIQNPVPVTGGADPQDPADIRTDAPASVVTFGRAISALDYEFIASQAPGVNRATAYWSFDPAQQRTVVSVYVGDDQAAVIGATAALAGAEDPNRPVVVRGATPVQISISCTLVVAADREVDAVVAAAAAALSDPVTGLFSPRRMAIGQPLYRSAASSALMVTGVLAVHELFILSSEQEVFDPGEGEFFMLSTGAVEIAGVSAGA
jgi:hypothetical protein